MTTTHADKFKPLVWLIEDDDDYAGKIQSILEEAGFRVTRYVSNDEAAKSVGKSKKPIAALVDYSTGLGRSGADFIRDLQTSSWSALPTIGISSAKDYNDAMKKAGAESTIEKITLMAPKRLPPNRAELIEDRERLREFYGEKIAKLGKKKSKKNQPNSKKYYEQELEKLDTYVEDRLERHRSAIAEAQSVIDRLRTFAQQAASRSY